MEQLKDRLKYARTLRGLSQKQLAKTIPTSQSTVHDLESGRIKTSSYLVRLADVLDVDVRWLIDGLGSPAAEGVKILNQGSPLPMYDWKGLADYTTSRTEHLGAIDVAYKCPVPHSDNAFCLPVTSLQAMDRFRVGEIIFVDPACRYNNSDFTVALVCGQCELRQLVTDGTHTYLKSDNENLIESARLLSVNVKVGKEAQVLFPTTSESKMDVELIGRVIMREEIF
ncbi:helix-turn-helix domain-containing protein [Sansalvadorimonas verongulae]|uniref:helix-turn-helix domain-containing protein n=1 Tax=Sansalvadorimonas verongulae TaxID=2172824 RepID=UPI0012BC65E3|nr:helix-turn-helix domain-containing protein [Sansalvadorimonas verongulae]MTI12394.1 helix-turn-helix domain-containing protein [Sansalvadorimonas verongulae]